MGEANAVPITIANNGSATLTISRYWLKYGSVFQIADSGAHSIAADGNASFAIDFLPIAHGRAVDTLFIASSDPSTPATATAIIGWGTEGIFHLSANPLDFGAVPLGGADTMLISLTNPGDGELDVYASSGIGTSPDFSIIRVGPQTAPPFVLMPGDTEVAEVQFAPSIVGPDTSFYLLTFADTAGELYDTNLVAVGVGLSPSSVAQAHPARFDFTIAPNPTPGLAFVSIS
ncbi:MAG: choice-of-anchor D domain-containing protein, partial [Candidatus Kapaibacterium sp.]